MKFLDELIQSFPRLEKPLPPRTMDPRKARWCADCGMLFDGGQQCPVCCSGQWSYLPQMLFPREWVAPYFEDDLPISEEEDAQWKTV